METAERSSLTRSRGGDDTVHTYPERVQDSAAANPSQRTQRLQVNLQTQGATGRPARGVNGTQLTTSSSRAVLWYCSRAQLLCPFSYVAVALVCSPKGESNRFVEEYRQ